VHSLVAVPLSDHYASAIVRVTYRRTAVTMVNVTSPNCIHELAGSALIRCSSYQNIVVPSARHVVADARERPPGTLTITGKSPRAIGQGLAGTGWHNGWCGPTSPRQVH
jgi:hypothetical protein